jgi:protein ImuB
MLWIALHFPNLALDSLVRGHGEQLLANMPLAITDGPAQRPTLFALNAAARDAGLRLGMPLAAARAVCDEQIGHLTALPRVIEKEQDALFRLSVWLAQFTPSVSLTDDGIVLEVSSSLMLFGGIGQIVNEIRRGVREQGFQGLVGVAPAPLAATLLARATQYHPGTRMCREPTELARRLAEIPLALFGWSHAVVQTLATLGLTRLQDLQALPRRGLTQRFGKSVMDDLDRALGLKGDPREFIKLPERFAVSEEFMFDVHDSAGLLPVAARMFAEMEGFLRARGAATTSIVVQLQHGRHAKTTITLGTREPARQASHWLALLREKFGNTSLTAAVVEMAVAADTILPYLPPSASLSSLLDNKSGSRREGATTLLDRIAIRLGDAAVKRIAVNDDHRPEYACSTTQVHTNNQDNKAKQHTRGVRGASGLRGAGDIRSQRDMQPTSAQKPKPATRPAWLLREPRALTTMNETPQYHGSLKILAGPERIETGWWDGKPVARDYFVAENPQHEVCWIYRDYRAGQKWYLHGLFA